MRLASFSKNTFGRASVILMFVICLATESPAFAGHRGHRPHHPRRGAVVHHLPVGFYALLIAGMTYFVFSEIYYQRVPSGYMVVDPPPRETIQAAVGRWVVVDVSELNVRSGPGLNYSLLFYVRMGDRLLIQGSAPAWYYVQLPNGSHGWVMSKFTRTLAPMPKG